ncbi:hypothetical protein B0T10DRAFT_97417 [Thelonectria olida]|uniref:Secreted protein n=1 Tax=Thelonectria olida TaxID=1576542 RepID=A0A9P9APL3_9HYPO|nr:hypothetical protein B0T10DRAFT_97417 [Thelonectria olida]
MLQLAHHPRASMTLPYLFLALFSQSTTVIQGDNVAALKRPSLRDPRACSHSSPEGVSRLEGWVRHTLCVKANGSYVTASRPNGRVVGFGRR